MAVDRGGLNYSIKIRDEFSKNALKFRNELAKSRRAFKEFRSDQVKNVKNAAAAEREQLRVEQQQLKNSREKLRNQQLQATIQRQNAAALTRAANQQQSAANAQARAAKQNAASQAKAAAAQIRAANQTAAAQAKAAAAQQSAAKKALVAQVKATNQQKTLTRETQRTDEAAGGLLFKFRRLVGTLAVFTVAREAVAGFNTLVASAVQFNDTIEGSTLGVAGLISAIGQVRNAEGQIVEGAEAFNVALGISRDQIAALRQDSLKTVATFEELLETFQVALGPGLAAGLGLDEVRTLSVQISQAATALQVPQNQLAEEIRSLLSGTIQARTTRIATALGITNEDVRLLKESGTLFKELNKRLAEFSIAAERAARSTVGGVATLLRGALQEALGAAAGGLTGELLGTLNEVLTDVVTIRNELGELKPNPRFVAAFEQVFDAIRRALASARELAGGSGFQALEGTLQAVAITIDVISGALLGISSIVATIVSVLQAVSDELGFSSDELGNLTQSTAKWLTILFSVRFAASQILDKFKGIQGIIRLLNAEQLIAFTAALSLAAASVDRIVEAVTGVNTNLKETVQLLVLGLAKGLTAVVTPVRKLAANISQAFLRAINEIVTGAQIAAKKAKAFLIEESFIGDPAEAQRLRDEVAVLEQGLKTRNDAIKRAAEEELALLDERAKNRQEAFDREIAAILNQADPNTTQPGAPAAPGAPRGTAAPDPAADPEIAEQLRQLAREQALLAAQARAANVGTGAGDGGVREAVALLDVSRQQLEVRRAENREELKILVNKSKQLPIGGEAREQVLQLISALAARNSEEEKVIQAKIRQGELDVEAIRRQQELAQIERRRAREQADRERQRRFRQNDQIANGSIGDGFTQGALDFGAQFASSFKAGLEISRGLLNDFAAFASSTIVDAFDPTKDFDLKERIARFLQQIAATIIQNAIKVAIAQRILASQSAAIGAAQSAGVGTAANVVGALFGGGAFFNKGGPVHETSAARGYARGGKPRRPSHVPASDTIPAWLTPGEFVMRKEAVDSLGIDTLASLNSGNIGVTGSGDAASPSAGGMASGGVVGNSVQGGSDGGGMVLPAIVANERTVNQLNAGGRKSQLKFMRENRNTIGAILPGGRRKKR